MKYDEYVCLGMCCEIGFVIQKLGLSMVSYPFDWSWVPSLKDVCKLIKDDFRQFDTMTNEIHDVIKRDMYRVGNLDFWVPHYDGNYKALQDKFDNFRKLMKTEKRVLFIYKSHVNYVPDASSVQLFINTIKEISKITFDVLIVNECDIGKTIDIEYPKEHCISKVLYGKSTFDAYINVNIIIRCNWSENPPRVHQMWSQLLTSL